MTTKKKALRLRKKIASALRAFLILAIFTLPLYTTYNWINGIFNETHDPRKVVAIDPLATRKVDETGQFKVFEEPLVSITFDDGWESIYSNAVPIMQRHGIRSTQYIITGTFDNHSYMSKKQVQSLKDAGTDIGSHTVSHKNMTTLTSAELTSELEGSKIALEANFGTTRDFTSPLGAYNSRTIETVKKYYRSHKNAEGDPAANELQSINIKDTFDTFNIKSYSVRSTTTDEDIKKLIHDAQAHNGWLVLTYHQVDDSNELFAVSPEVFNRQMAIVSTSSLKSVQLGDILDSMEQTL